mmetsp:Transcript_32726/g.68821  ORF Transcript_32726/g.68821 Transcript_32726/m.68821 type:complete len:162 (-) Transcript_32726:39-524(-)
MQMTLARQLGLVMHLASGTRHFLRRHVPMAFPSAALADGTEERKSPLGPVRAEKDSVRARRAEVAIFPTRSKTSSLVSFGGIFLTIFLTVLSSKRLLSCAAWSAWGYWLEIDDGREMIVDGFNGAKELHSGASARRGSNVFRELILICNIRPRNVNASYLL